MTRFNKIKIMYPPGTAEFIKEYYLNSRCNSVINPASIGNAGFDLVVPYSHLCAVSLGSATIDLGVSLRVYDKDDTLMENPISFPIYARSSIYKTGAFLANSVAIIDSTYRGNIKHQLYFMPVPSRPIVYINQGTSISQVCMPNLDSSGWEVFVEEITPETEERDKTIRGNGGFGSTGK
jgi:dUTPase